MALTHDRKFKNKLEKMIQGEGNNIKISVNYNPFNVQTKKNCNCRNRIKMPEYIAYKLEISV